jgi:hypothetical protein
VEEQCAEIPQDLWSVHESIRKDEASSPPPLAHASFVVVEPVRSEIIRPTRTAGFGARLVVRVADVVGNGGIIVAEEVSFGDRSVR